MPDSIESQTARFPLAHAMDALGEAARQAGRPGLVWIAGLAYPSIGIGIIGTWEGPMKWVAPDPSPGTSMFGGSTTSGSPFDFLSEAYLPLFGLPFIAFLFLPLFRLIAGLAKAGSADAWQLASEGRRNPRLRALWKLGQGLMFSTYGLWLQLVLMQILAFVVLIVPILVAAHSLDSGSDEHELWTLLRTGMIVGPFILVFGLYMLALSVLGQFALQSLAENRRGVSSALLHAWRIMRHDPRATGRAVVAEVVLLVVILGAARAISGILGNLPLSDVVTIILQFALFGFAGVVRAGYWARAYRALGGLTPADGVPGLATR